EARHAARKTFGGVEQAQERSRDARGVRWIEDLWQDLRYGARMLVKNPAFSITAISILAIGIGANTAIFSLVYAGILRPLPFAEPERLAMIMEDLPAQGVPDVGASMPDFLEWRNRNRVFDQLEAFSTDSYDISSDGDPERIAGAEVSVELFPFLGVPPAQDRPFHSEERQFGRTPAAPLPAPLCRRSLVHQTRPK